MKRKLKVAILFGGKSSEHEVSLQSAQNVIKAIDRDKYEPLLIGIDKQGGWHLAVDGAYLLHADDPRLIALNKTSSSLQLNPGQEDNPLSLQAQPELVGKIDVVFPVLHGQYGEDGTVQGLFKLLDLPFVGAGVLGSAVGMDKDVMKRLLRDAGIPIADFRSYNLSQRTAINFDQLARELGLPLFVKPANLGSSVGISRVSDATELESAVQMAFTFDRKIIIEENIDGREIECAVLGNFEPQASVPGEIINNKERHSFYSYAAKYIDEKGASLEIPANLPGPKVEEIRKLAVSAYLALCCEGMARVDFFLKSDGSVIVNEINTIPGFTAISMYPKLWQASGKSYPELISELIELACRRHAEESRLKIAVDVN